MAFTPGQTVGEYEILSVLGTGGMGRVYRVRNVISDRVEAMKVLLPDFTAEPELAARFIAEIRTLASLDHPNIAQLHTAFQMENQLVMMMEFVEGFTLEQRARQGPLPPAEVMEFTLQILAALSYAHERGVVHRDIKPANVMVTSHGIVKLTDFGIAKSRTDNQLTQPGTTLGSVYYMSPEQVRGAAVDGRSDLYSVGILLYELLSGRRPFEGDTTYGVLNQQLNAAPRPPVELNPLLPRPLNDLILLALAKDPAQRFQSADAFRNALSICAGKLPPAASRQAASDAPAACSPAAPSPATPSPAFSPVGTAESVPWTPVNPAPPSALPSRKGGSQRVLWVTGGALSVVVLLAAAAIGLPHFFRAGAASSNGAPSPQPARQLSPAMEPASTAASATPSQIDPATPAPLETAPQAHTAVNARPQASRVPANQSQSAPRPAYTPGNPPPPPVPQVSGQLPAASQSPSQPPEPASPSPAQLRQARDRRIQLDARAAAVSASLDNLRRQQEADGYSLRQDIAGAASRMRTYLQIADADLNNGDIPSAQRDMDRADKEISTLEAFFNR